MLGEIVFLQLKNFGLSQENKILCVHWGGGDHSDRKSWEILWCLNWNMKDKGLPSSIKREIILGRRNKWRKEQKETQKAWGILGVSKITCRGLLNVCEIKLFDYKGIIKYLKKTYWAVWTCLLFMSLHFKFIILSLSFLIQIRKTLSYTIPNFTFI